MVVWFCQRPPSIRQRKKTKIVSFASIIFTRFSVSQWTCQIVCFIIIVPSNFCFSNSYRATIDFFLEIKSFRQNRCVFIYVKIFFTCMCRNLFLLHENHHNVVQHTIMGWKRDKKPSALCSNKWMATERKRKKLWFDSLQFILLNVWVSLLFFSLSTFKLSTWKFVYRTSITIFETLMYSQTHGKKNCHHCHHHQHRTTLCAPVQRYQPWYNIFQRV